MGKEKLSKLISEYHSKFSLFYRIFLLIVICFIQDKTSIIKNNFLQVWNRTKLCVYFPRLIKFVVKITHSTNIECTILFYNLEPNVHPSKDMRQNKQLKREGNN